MGPGDLKETGHAWVTALLESGDQHLGGLCVGLTGCGLCLGESAGGMRTVSCGKAPEILESFCGANGALAGPVQSLRPHCRLFAEDFVQLPVPTIQQLYHWDCGLACSRMVLR